MQHHYLVEHSNIEPVKPKIESLVQQQPEKLTTNAEVSFTKTGKQTLSDWPYLFYLKSDLNLCINPYNFSLVNWKIAFRF